MSNQSISKIIAQHKLWAISLLVSLLTASLYLSIAPTHLTNANYGGDGGDFLSAVLTGGIPHPSGYPTYVLLGKIFQLLPFSTPAFRAVLESLLPAALAAGLLTGWMGYAIGSSSFPSLAAAVLAGTSWGVAPLLMSQAVIIEVHGLQSLIVVIMLWWITLNLDIARRRHTSWLLGLAFLVGVGAGNHLTILLFAPAVILVLTLLARNPGTRGLALAQIALIATGLLVYLYLPLRAHTYPPINWGNPQTVPGFIWEVSGQIYRHFIFGTKAPEFLDRLRSVTSMLLGQFGALGLLAGALGVVQYSFEIKWLRWVLIWVFCAFLAYAIGYSSADPLGYLVPAIMVFSIWIGLAVPSIWNIKWRWAPIGALLTALLLISICVRIPHTRLLLDPRPLDQPARYAEQLLQQAPPNSIVYTTTDQDSFPLWYYHFGLRRRLDLHIVVLTLTQFVWYQQTLVHTYPDLSYPAVDPVDQPNVEWGAAISHLNPELPVCKVRIAPGTETGITFQCTNP